MFKTLFNLIESKPIVGYVLAAQGGAAGLFVWIKMLTPIIGFFSAVLGLVAAAITIRIKWRELKKK